MYHAISHDEHRERYARLQERIETEGLDAHLSWTPENIYYLTGFDTLGYYFPQCLVSSVSRPPVLVIRHFETPNVEALTWLSEYRGYRDHERMTDVVQEVARSAGERIGTESAAWFVSPAMESELRAALGERIVSADGLVEGLRLVKSPAEIALIREAARYTDAAMEAAFGASCAGGTEDDVAAAVYARMIAAGSSYPSLAPFIATGERTSLPHATWSGRVLQPGDALFYETGGSAGRYGAGLIRVGSIGEPPDDRRATIDRALEVIGDALEALIAAIRPDATGHEVDEAGRVVIEASGWGDVHRNRAGYSFGISYPPDWGEGHIFSLRQGEHRPLQEGMVFHLVPNVLLPDAAGIAMSETVLVTSDGCEALTRFPREYVVV